MDFFLVPRKVLRESFDIPLELDEQNQTESAYENELDEDDAHYKESEAIPPAPKLQGAIPRTETNSTQSITTKGGSITGSVTGITLNEHTFHEGKLIGWFSGSIKNLSFYILIEIQVTGVPKL